MIYRKLGRTEKYVSEIGFGTWGIGGQSYGNVNENESTKCLLKAFELGINLFDTANIYGLGKSEILLGNTFKNIREKIFIISKCGYVPKDVQFDFQIKKQDFSESYIKKSLECSLNRLNTNYLDLYLLHSPPTDIISDRNVQKTLINLKNSKKIKHIGISLKNVEDGFIVLEDSEIYDVIEVIFNIFYQKVSELRLLEKFYSENIGVIIKTPLSHGFLSENYQKYLKFEKNDHRRRLPLNQINYWKSALNQYSSIWKNKNLNNVEAALKFILSNPYISSTIPGMKIMPHINENVNAADGKYFTQEELNRFQKIYSKIKHKSVIFK